MDLWCDQNNNNATMAECACALTSASMVMNYHGVKMSPGGSFPNSPGYLNLFANETLGSSVGKKGFAGGNFIWEYAENFSALAASHNNNDKVELASRENFNVDRVKQLIDEGKPIIVKVTGIYGIHWVVIKGYDPDDNRLIINDPAKPDPPFGEYLYLNDYYTPSNIGSMIVYQQTHSDFRRLQFATNSNTQLLITDNLGNKTGFDNDSGQILQQIPDSSYALDEFYGDPTGTPQSPSTTGIYFLTLKLPSDGEYKLEVIGQNNHQLQIYSSNVSGELIGEALNVEGNKNFNVVYDQNIAGEEINIIEEVIPVEIDVRPWSQRDWVLSKGRLPVPVSIFSNVNVSANSIDKSTIRFGKTGNENSLSFCLPWYLDINRDGKGDLTCTFDMSKTGLEKTSTQAIFTATTISGQSLKGIGKVKVLR